MGQGYSLTTLSAGAAGIDVPELGDLSYEKSLGDARFMKAIRARHHDGLVVAKVVMKPYSSMEFGKYITEINRELQIHMYKKCEASNNAWEQGERKVLADIPNALGYHRAFETSSNGFLVRQYVYSSIYDRLSTRPFLEDIEKKWIAFQLLYAIRDCHARDVYHGDIKTENTLVTSWNWLYLSDFSSSFKPTFLPEDNPADFSFYFDIAGRRTCYLAPERFLKPGEKYEGRKINWAMDVFSVGCVIAELFLETPIFNLSQLFNYRKGEYDPNQLHLSRIEDKDIRELIAHMIQLEPESRYSADEYLNFWRHKVFPEYFYNFLHQYMYVITDPTSGRSPITAGVTNLGESDDRIDRVFYDFDKISFFLGYDDDNSKDAKNLSKVAFNQLFPLHLDIPNKREISTTTAAPAIDDGTLLFLSIVTSALRSTARATARIRACELLLAFSERVTDETKLDRVLPYIIALTHDSADIIKVAALRTLTQMIALVSTISPINAYIFPEYILPRLDGLSPLSGRKLSPLVRATYALCLATLAESAGRLLDVTQAYKAETSLSVADPKVEDGIFVHAYQDLYDAARADLVRTFEAQTKALLTDPNPDVRRAFLGSVSSLCVFFGSPKSNDVILSHLNTYLNDRDWKLKCAFFETIVGVATYVGSTNLEEFILPLMVQALSDPQETVVEKVLRSLATMAQLGLFQRSRTWGLIDLVGRFTMHPNIWIREAATHFLASVIKFLSTADCQCIVKPLLLSYLRYSPTSMTESTLLDTLKKPLPRPILDSAILWASKVSDGLFWKSVKQRLTSNLMENRIPVAPSIEAGLLSKAQKSPEDVKWITRLRNLGMKDEDEFKLMALRKYIWRVSQRQAREDTEISDTMFNAKIALKDIGLDLQTIFFDRTHQMTSEALNQGSLEVRHEGGTQTIEHALHDASNTTNSLRPQENLPSSIHTKRALLKNSFPIISSPSSSSPKIQAQAQDPLTRHDLGQDIPEFAHLGLQLSSSTGTNFLSPADSASLSSHHHMVSRKGSAMDLMQRKTSVAKAGAETSTSAANAIGHAYIRDAKMKLTPAAAQQNAPPSTNLIRYQAAHTYGGRDPSVLKLLDTVYLENHPADSFEFGPSVTSLPKVHWDQKPETISKRHLRPSGTLVAMFGEHSGPVNRVVISPDHLFFITGSDDGSVKIWDCARLERNLAHRSRQTHKHAAKTKVTSLCFIMKTHCFVSTGSDGSIHIVKVDCAETAQGTTKYGKLRLLRQCQLPDSSCYAVWVEHFRTETESVLVVATNTSQIVAIDTNTMNILYTLENPLHHGTPTCFCLDSQYHWLLLGTSHGVLDLWDLRFRMRLRAWGFPGASPIHRLSLHPRYGTIPNDTNEQPSKPVCVAGGTGSNEITVWDLNKAICLEVFRTVSPRASSNVPASLTTTLLTDMKPYTFQDIDATPSAKLLVRFTSTIVPPLQSSTDRGARAIAVSTLGPTFIVAAGSDQKLRFWDLKNVTASCVVSGLEAEEGNPTYTTLGTPLQPKIHEEKSVSRDQERERLRREVLNPLTGLPTGGPRESSRSDAREAIKPSRTTVIGEQQARLLRNHLDIILDVAVIEFPMRMVVSVDRSGMIYVFS